MATTRSNSLFLYFSIFLTAFAVHSASAQSFQQLRACLLLAGVEDDIILSRNTTPITYNEVNSQWNSRGGMIYPLAYLLAESSTDVQKAVACGRRFDIRVTTKAGGHGFGKYAFGDSNTFVVDLRRMADVLVDVEGKTVTVGAGARQGKVAYLLWEQGNFITATGICPAVGIAGYSLGGGQGLFVREFGVMSDNMLEVEMVDAEGRLLVANDVVNADLIWALRGGGGGNFGIVTKFKFKVYPAPPTVTTFSLTYEFNKENFLSAFSAYQQYVATNFTAMGAFLMFEGNRTFSVDFFELSYDDRKPQAADIIAMFPRTQNLTFDNEPYPMFLMRTSLGTYNDRIRPNVNITVPSDLINISDGVGQEFYRRKSFFVTKMLNSSEIEALFEIYQKILPTVPQWIEPYGGAANIPHPSDTAFVHRGQMLYKMNIRYEGVTESPTWNVEANEFFEESKKIFGHTTSYQNYIDDDMEDYLERYYGANLEKLIRIKTALDPDNFFHHPQSIPVAEEPVDNGDSGASLPNLNKLLLNLGILKMVLSA